MDIRIGEYEVISGADTITVFAMQIGVTRIGAGGRCLPRTRRGAMTTVANLVAQLGELPEVIELVVLPRVAAKVALLARAVVAVAAWVVVQPAAFVASEAARLLLCTGRSLVSALKSKTVANLGLGIAFVAWFAHHPVGGAFLKCVGHAIVQVVSK